MIRAVHAEWTKLRTVSSTGWTALAAVLGMVALGTFATLSLRLEDGPDAVRISLSGVYLGQAAVVVLAVLAVTPEYETTLIRTTLAADPRRLRVLAAKIGVVLMITMAAAALAVLGSLVSGRITLAGKGFAALSLSDGPTLRAYAGTALYLGLIALLSLGIGMAMRHTGATITTVLSLLYPLPLIAVLVTDPVWRDRVLRVAPMTAGLAIQATRDLDAQPIAPWSGLAVLTGYAAVALGLGSVLFARRDA